MKTHHLGEFFPSIEHANLAFAALVKPNLWALRSGLAMALTWLSKQWATFRQWLGRTEVPVQLEVVQLGSETKQKKDGQMVDISSATDFCWGCGSQKNSKLIATFKIFVWIETGT